jgi:ferritin-like metal-binding protein YciE
MEVKNLENLYTDGLRDLYSAETQLVDALPKIAQSINETKLQGAIENHLKVTKKQVERLEKIFDELGESPKGHECMGMKGLLEEGKELMKNVEAGPVLDAALIGAAQKVEHYEIAGYGTMRNYAYLLGHENHAKLLQETLDEEGAADKELTRLAEGMVNEMAAEQDGAKGSAAGRGASKKSSAKKK